MISSDMFAELRRKAESLVAEATALSQALAALEGTARSHEQLEAAEARIEATGASCASSAQG